MHRRGPIVRLALILLLLVPLWATPAASVQAAPRTPDAVGQEIAGPDMVWIGTPSNTLQTLKFGPATNATVTVGTQQGPGSFTVSLPAGTAKTTVQLKRTTPGQAVTVPLTVTDGCGDWPTFVGGGPNAFGTAGPATAPSPVPAGAPTALTGAVTCSPRPGVLIASEPEAEGRLRVTVRALGDGNALRTLRFGAATNATVIAGGKQGPGNLTVDLSPASQQAIVEVVRTTAGQPVTVPLTVVDGCGDWPTFFGGGANAF